MAQGNIHYGDETEFGFTSSTRYAGLYCIPIPPHYLDINIRVYREDADNQRVYFVWANNLRVVTSYGNAWKRYGESIRDEDMVPRRKLESIDKEERFLRGYCSKLNKLDYGAERETFRKQVEASRSYQRWPLVQRDNDLLGYALYEREKALQKIAANNKKGLYKFPADWMEAIKIELLRTHFGVHAHLVGEQPDGCPSCGAYISDLIRQVQEENRIPVRKSPPKVK